MQATSVSDQPLPKAPKNRFVQSTSAAHDLVLLKEKGVLRVISCISAFTSCLPYKPLMPTISLKHMHSLMQQAQTVGHSPLLYGLNSMQASQRVRSAPAQGPRKIVSLKAPMQLMTLCFVSKWGTQGRKLHYGFRVLPYLQALMPTISSSTCVSHGQQIREVRTALSNTTNLGLIEGGPFIAFWLSSSAPLWQARNGLFDHHALNILFNRSNQLAKKRKHLQLSWPCIVFKETCALKARSPAGVSAPTCFTALSPKAVV